MLELDISHSIANKIHFFWEASAHRAAHFLYRVQVDRGRVRVTMHDCTKQGLPGHTCNSAQTCLVSLHSLFSFTGAARSTISWVLLSESDFKAADQHWAVHHNFTPPSHFLSSVSTHLSVPHHSSISVSLCFSFRHHLATNQVMSHPLHHM